MNTSFKRTAIAAVAALALAAGVAVSTTAPAEASGVWQHGYSGGHYYGGGGYWRGGGWGPVVGLGILGGAIAGAAIANSGPYYGPGPAYGYGYGDPCWQPRPMYDSWGRFVGNRMVNTCY
jgi:hypothetical protein